MRMPNGYNETQEYGNYRVLPPGGYVCVIKNVAEHTASSGKEMLKVSLDIAEGDYRGYFMEQYQLRRLSADDASTVKWSNDGTKYVSVLDQKGSCSRDFKTFCACLEDQGIKVWSDSKELMMDNLRNQIIGVTFGREENEWNGKRTWHTKPKYFVRVDDIHSGNFSVPADKPLASEPAFEPYAATSDDLPF